jgi:hypothetical protein
MNLSLSDKCVFKRIQKPYDNIMKQVTTKRQIVANHVIEKPRRADKLDCSQIELIKYFDRMTAKEKAEILSSKLGAS